VGEAPMVVAERTVAALVEVALKVEAMGVEVMALEGTEGTTEEGAVSVESFRAQWAGSSEVVGSEEEAAKDWEEEGTAVAETVAGVRMVVAAVGRERLR
jgi:predicted SpoU family rRNA methylase